jgi:hypothetical protein
MIIDTLPFIPMVLLLPCTDSDNLDSTLLLLSKDKAMTDNTISRRPRAIIKDGDMDLGDMG